ncbi:hypothetical protein M9458_043661, partial [Cirrhinus mrigala]
KAYSDKLEQRCCVDGMREIPMPYSCYRRSLYITEDWSCVLAFLRCCAEYRGEELGVVTRPTTTTTKGARMFRAAGVVRVKGVLWAIVVLKVGTPTLNLKVEDLGEDDLADLEDIYVRTKFFESWLWTDIILPSVPKTDG